MSVNKDGIKCDNDTFGRNPHDDVRKYCYQASIGNINIPSATTQPKWVQVAGGSGCAGGSIERNVQIGSTWSETWTKTDEWSQAVTVSFSAAFMGIGPNLETTTAFVESQSYANELSRGETIGTTFSCACEPNSTSYIYQFQTTTAANCLSSQSCDVEVLPHVFHCVSVPNGTTNPPAAPKCFPTTYCVNDFCQECTDDNYRLKE